MKSKSTLFFLAGIAVGTIAGLFIVPQKSLRSRRDLRRKSGMYNKAFKDAASKYKEKLADNVQ